MKTSNILRRVKQYVKTPEDIHNASYEKSSFCCWAAGRAQANGVITKRSARHVQVLFHKRLGKFSTLEEWLAHHAPWTRVTVGTLTLTIAKRAKLQETRHAWIDHMIAEFEAKGD